MGVAVLRAIGSRDNAYKDKRTQRKCEFCKLKTAMFCKGCSNPPNEIHSMLLGSEFSKFPTQRKFGLKLMMKGTN